MINWLSELIIITLLKTNCLKCILNIIISWHYNRNNNIIVWKCVKYIIFAPNNYSLSRDSNRRGGDILLLVYPPLRSVNILYDCYCYLMYDLCFVFCVIIIARSLVLWLSMLLFWLSWYLIIAANALKVAPHYACFAFHSVS